MAIDPISIGEALDATQRIGSALHATLDAPAFANAVDSIAGTPIRDLEHHACGFEIRLDDDDTVDLGVMLTPDGGRDDFANPAASGSRSCLHQSGEWERLFRLCSDWADPVSHAHSRIRQMFLEFDAPEGARPEVPIPSVFLSVSSKFGWEVVDATSTPEWLLEEGLATLLGGPLPPPVAATAGRCMAALPGDGRLLHAAVMLGREPVGLRLFFAVPVSDVAGTLDRCGWPGDPSALVDLHVAYAAKHEFVQLQLDLSSGVSERIGVEFSPAPAAWPTLLDWLVRDGLALDEKRTALLDWPDVMREPLASGGWPCTFVRELSHVKIVHQPGLAARAKAYVTVTSGHELDLTPYAIARA